MISPQSLCQFVIVLVYQHVSMAVSKRIFYEMAHRIFLKLLMKLGYLKGTLMQV